MDNKINNGDMPAMPHEAVIDTKSPMGHGTKKISYSGMTKREQFAMAAMQGLSACPDNYDAVDVPRIAVEMADALLKALEDNNG